MEGQLARLTSLFEDMAVRPRVPRPFIQNTSHLPRGTDRPSLRQLTLTAPLSFVIMPRPINQSSSSRGKPSGQKAAMKRKNQWDPIPVTYAELLPKLIGSGHIKPIQARPRRPPFPKWYDVNIRCDYHFGVPGHSIEDCTILKNKVRNLIQEGKLKFEKSDGPAEVKYPSRAKAKMSKREKECVTMLVEEHDSQTFKRRWILGSNEA